MGTHIGGRSHRALVTAAAALRRVRQLRMVKLLPNAVIKSTAKIALVCFHNVHHHLRVLILLVLGNATV